MSIIAPVWSEQNHYEIIILYIKRYYFRYFIFCKHRRFSYTAGDFFFLKAYTYQEMAVMDIKISRRYRKPLDFCQQPESTDFFKN